MSDTLTAGGVPVYRDSAGILREIEGARDEELRAQIAAEERAFEQYGGGFIDYSDNGYATGTTTAIAANTAYVVDRDLSASAANSRLNRPFDAWQPWDNSAKRIRARALYDIIGIRMEIRLVPDKVGAVVRVSLTTPTVELAGKNMPLTAQPGVEEKITVDFPQLAVRNSFFQNGAAFMLTSNVPIVLREFSPEFFPLGYEP